MPHTPRQDQPVLAPGQEAAQVDYQGISSQIKIHREPRPLALHLWAGKKHSVRVSCRITLHSSARGNAGSELRDEGVQVNLESLSDIGWKQWRANRVPYAPEFCAWRRPLGRCNWQFTVPRHPSNSISMMACADFAGGYRAPAPRCGRNSCRHRGPNIPPAGSCNQVALRSIRITPRAPPALARLDGGSMGSPRSGAPESERSYCLLYLSGRSCSTTAVSSARLNPKNRVPDSANAVLGVRK